MRKAVLIIALLAAGCGSADYDAPDPMTVMETNWSTTLTANSGFSGARGEAVARSNQGGTGASIAFAEASRGGGTVRPWHVHAGRCGSNGPIVGDARAYSPLRPGSNGTATSSATVTVPLVRGNDYFVNVHASPTDLGTIIACGNLSPQ